MIQSAIIDIVASKDIGDEYAMEFTLLQLLRQRDPMLD